MHPSLKGGAKMKPGWIVLITVIVVGAVVGTILGVYFGGLNKVSQYVPPPPRASEPVAKMSAPATSSGCDGKVVNPAACMSSNSKRNNKKMRACTGCTNQQQCVNDQCQNLCAPKCPVGACQGSGSGLSTGIPDGCGGTCCGCLAPATCVNGQCTPPGTCNPACGAGTSCQGGTCKPINNTCPTTCLPGWSCVSGECQQPGGCTTVCKTNEKCVSGSCVCQPNCSPTSCGPDGCGGTCTCPAGQTCNTSTQTCSSCAPTCTDGVCGNSDNCGGICGCPAGQVCQSGKCVTDTQPWEGWATTTEFGSGDGPWGDKDPAEDLSLINDPKKGIMGGAIPWKELCNRYGTKEKQVESVVGSAAGTNSDKSCFLVQPINKYPDQISGLTDPLFPAASMCDSSKGPCTDINDPSLAAVDKNGNTYPSYLVMPFEGCGGNCKVTSGSGPDCINDCVSGDAASYGVNCQWDKLTNPLCAAAKVMYDGGNWGWNDTIKANLEQYSDITAIDPRTDYGRNIMNTIKGLNEDHANYCTGQNMHLDMALVDPYWMSLPKGNIAYLTADSNIMLRYKRVPCNYFGNVDINVPASTSTPCPDGYYSIPTGSSCSTSVLNPGDAKWLNSGLADHSCCFSGAGANKCYAGQVYQASGGACPCPSGQCFFNTNPPIDGSSGLCGQCSASPAACSSQGAIKC